MPLLCFISKISKVLSPIRLFNALRLLLWKCYNVMSVLILDLTFSVIRRLE